MELTVGTIYDGKVTGITKFGAFVALPGGKSGMVHISEVANTYVEDIKQYLAEGQGGSTFRSKRRSRPGSGPPGGRGRQCLHRCAAHCKRPTICPLKIS